MFFKKILPVRRQSPHRLCTRHFQPQNVSQSVVRPTKIIRKCALRRLVGAEIIWKMRSGIWTYAIWRLACGLAALWSFVTYHSWQSCEQWLKHRMVKNSQKGECTKFFEKYQCKKSDKFPTFRLKMSDF